MGNDKQVSSNVRIFMGFTLAGAVLLEVVDHGQRAVSKVSKVDGLASLLQEEHAIEHLFTRIRIWRPIMNI